MGNLCCKKRIKKKIVLLLVGLDNAGKTVAAKGLAGESIDSVVPTVGFSIINLNYLHYIVKIFDLGGGANIRGIWHKYFVDAYGVIFVVDSSDFSRLEEAKSVLLELLSHEKISKKPVLLLANKQDNENALDEVDIVEKLELEKIVNGNECPTLVETCSATETSGSIKIDPGIKKGYEWLLNYIIRNYDLLNKRVEEDVMEQLEVEKTLRMQRMEMIRLQKEQEQKMRQEDEDAIESYSNYERKISGQQQTPNGAIENDDTNSEDSFDSFPPVYHIQENIAKERPKSAVRIVREQLEQSNIGKKTSFISRASNKTAPIHLYGMQTPRSASTLRNTLQNQRRNLKSAGDVPYQSFDLPNVPISSGDEFHNEICSLMHLDKMQSGDHIRNGTCVYKNINGDTNILRIMDL